jgi:hypothetical protein
MTTTAYRVLHLACCGAILALAAMAAPPARADFFDDARKTFTTDIPHFFQDDIPCAFGGQPTSHTKASCKSNGPAPVEQGRTTKERPLDPPPPGALSPPPEPPPPTNPDQ